VQKVLLSEYKPFIKYVSFFIGKLIIDTFTKAYCY